MFRDINNRIAGIALALLFFSLGVFPGCNRMITPRTTQLVADADAKAEEGKFVEAIGLYEAALDGSASSAEVHYKLALLYDDKMNDPLNALHHFKRFLTLAPTGKRADEVKQIMQRDELSLLTNLSGDAILTRGEGVRLRNENLNLRKQIEDRWAQKRAAGQAEKSAARAPSPNEPSKSETKTRNYTVQRGDTLASISRKFYQSSSHWGKILASNPEILAKPTDLKPGMTLRIP